MTISISMALQRESENARLELLAIATLLAFDTLDKKIVTNGFREPKILTARRSARNEVDKIDALIILLAALKTDKINSARNIPDINNDYSDSKPSFFDGARPSPLLSPTELAATSESVSTNPQPYESMLATHQEPIPPSVTETQPALTDATHPLPVPTSPAPSAAHSTSQTQEPMDPDDADWDMLADAPPLTTNSAPSAGSVAKSGLWGTLSRLSQAVMGAERQQAPADDSRPRNTLGSGQ